MEKIHLICPIRTIDWIAVSGGLDSMACLNFIVRGGHRVKVVHFNHGTAHAQDAENFVTGYCDAHNLELEIGKVTRPRESNESWEEYWRNQRYGFMDNLNGIGATCHHLNDVAETYLFGTINGTPKIIPWRRNNIFRPFLATARSALENLVLVNRVPYINDPSNSDLNYNRNRIRHEVLPQVLKVNPGFLKVVRRKLMEELD